MADPLCEVAGTRTCRNHSSSTRGVQQRQRYISSALSSEAGKLSERFADCAVFRFVRVSAGVGLAQLYEEAGRAKDAQERLRAATAQANAASEKMLQGMEERRFAAASLASWVAV